MANPNPIEGRAKARRNRQSAMGDISQLRSKLWALVEKLDGHIAEHDVTPDLLKVAHALIQTAGVYLRAVEVGDLEAHVKLIQEQVNELSNQIAHT